MINQKGLNNGYLVKLVKQGFIGINSRGFFLRIELNKWAFIHKVLTMEEIDDKVNQYVFFGKRDWALRNYELIYK